jgi:glycosyltransferase involved in cell wall biosynthesis
VRLLIISEDPGPNGGGIPGYTVPLAEALASRGHEVDYLYSGGYTGEYDWFFARRWRTFERGRVRYHCLVNARSIGLHMGRPDLDVVCDDSRWIARRAHDLKADVIHVHSLVGLPLETIPALASVAPVVFSFHDYALVCQRRVLVRPGAGLSRRYQQQSDCPSCVEPIDPARYRLRARLRRTPAAAGIRVLYALERASGRDISISTNGAAPARDAAEPYRRRLREGVAAVNNHAARVLAVSHAVHRVLTSVGVSRSLAQVMHIGSSSADGLARLPLPSAAGKDVTFLSLGSPVSNKGVHVLLEAVGRLSPPPRLIVTGSAFVPEWEEHLRALASPSVEFYGQYSQADLPHILGMADVVVAPAIGPDTSPQAVLEALAAGRPVIGSHIGGIPDFVRDGVNGRLFKPGDVVELARIMDELRDPTLVARLAAEARKHKRLDEHVDELETLYADLS